jgi:hypothetical protein
MTVTRLGELSLSAAVPLLAAFKASIDLAAGIATPDLTAKIGGLGNVLGAITVAPPDLAGTIDAALGTVASLQAAVGGPTVTLEAAAIQAQIDSLSAQLDELTAAADVAIPDGSLSAYVFDGDSGVLGAELQSAINGSLPGAPGRAYAWIIVTTSAADWAAAGEVFKVSA